MNACSWHQSKKRKEKKTLIQHVKGKQTIQIEEQRLKKYQKEPNRGIWCKRNEETETENLN